MAPFQHQRQRKFSNTTNESKNQAKKRKKSFKQQLRDVQRLLRQKDIPATVRVAQERMLIMLKDNLKESGRQEKEKKIVKKYKMVKFFEKRKVTRSYKSCVNELTQCTDQTQRDQLEKDLSLLKQQWNYITYFPKDEKYISLYPPTPCTNQQAIEQQEEILKLINEKVAKGELNDASSTILLSPKEKKKTSKPVSLGIRLSAQQDIQKGDEDDDHQLKQSSFDDDFFIDTKPSNVDCTVSSSKVEEESCASMSQQLPIDNTSHHHKVKRLKDERDVAASIKNKKKKKKANL